MLFHCANSTETWSKIIVVALRRLMPLFVLSESSVPWRKRT